MNSDTSRAGSGGEENSWETLAEDLFGINLGPGPAGEGMVTPEDLSLDEPESSPSPAKSAKSEPSATPPQGTRSTPPKKRSPDEGRSGGRHVTPRRPVAQEEDEFGADLGLEEPAADESQSGDLDDVVEDDVVEDEDEIVVAEEAGDEEEGSPAAEEGQTKEPGDADEDPYWDTLKTWQWGEEESEPAERSENRPRPGQRGGRGGPHRSGGRSSGGRERSGPRDRPGQGGPGQGGQRPGRGERRREDRPPSRGSQPPGERSRREQPAPPAHPESEEASDFGAGLLDDQSSGDPARGGDARQKRQPSEGRRSREEFAEPDESPEVPGEGESAEQTDSDRPPRRRRRRRRPRSRRERPGESAEQQGPSDRGDDVESELDEHAADETAADEQAGDEQGSDEHAADESHAEEESGVDVSRRSERDESTGPRRRRRRRRPGDRGPRRGPSSERPPVEDEADESHEALPIEASMGLASNFDDDEDDEDNVDLEAEGGAEGEADDEAPRVYRNVPTWEEAIGYLLHRRPGETRSREGDSRGERRDGGRRPNRGERPHD